MSDPFQNFIHIPALQTAEVPIFGGRFFNGLVAMALRSSFLLGIFFWIRITSAQTFVPVGGAVLQEEVQFEQANECWLLFDNPSGDPLTLRWRRVETSIPDGWDIDLCDYGLCYSGIPGNGLMNPVSGSTQPYLKLIVQPDTAAGAAWLWFRVWEDGNEDNFVDVYFSLHTPGITQTTAVAITPWRFFPNPARDWIVLENPGSSPLNIRLSDAEGRTVLEHEVPPLSRESLTLSNFTPGIYFLQSARQTEILIIRQD